MRVEIGKVYYIPKLDQMFVCEHTDQGGINYLYSDPDYGIYDNVMFLSSDLIDLGEL